MKNLDSFSVNGDWFDQASAEVGSVCSQEPIFRDSLVRELTAWRLVESSARFPDSFCFPAFCGSGVLFYGLDASGLQSLTSGLCAKHIPWFGTNAEALYVFHKRMHSTHLIEDDQGDLTNQMPLGYMTFSITVDGVEMAPGQFITRSRDWERITDLLTGTTTTSYTINNSVAAIRLSITHVTRMGSAAPHFRWTVASADGRTHRVTVHLELKLRLRGGTPLWDLAPETRDATPTGAVMATARTLRNGAFLAAEDYAMGWGVHMCGAAFAASSNYQSRPNRLTLSAIREVCVEEGSPAQFDSCLVFATGTAAAESVRAELARETAIGFSATLEASTAYWQAFFQRVAEIEIGSPKDEFLYHRSLQMLDACLALDSGLPPSFQAVAGCPWWSNSTFHDSMYAARGLLQCNAVEEVTELLEWLRDRCWQREERPVYWLTRYDGLALTRDKNDLGFLALATMAMIPILYTEVIGPGVLERLEIYPMLRQVTRFVARRLLVKRDDQFYLTVAVTQDLGSECYVDKSAQDAFLLLGLRTVFRKAHEYATRLGENEEERRSWLEIAEHLHVPRNAQGELVANNGGAIWAWPFCWLPVFCLSPHDPQLSAPQIAKWRRIICHEHFEGQPWGCFVLALGALSWRDGGLAQKLIDEGCCRGSFGLGYFSEFILDGLESPHAGSLANLPPFATAHGAYLMVAIEQLLRGSLWDGRVEIGPLPGSRLAERAWALRRGRALGGATVTATGHPEGMAGVVTADTGRPLVVELIRPSALVDRRLELWQDGVVTCLDEGSTPRLSVPGGNVVEFRLKE